MPDLRLDLTDATELAEMLHRRVAGQQPTAHPRRQLRRTHGPHTTYDIDGLRADLHRFAFLLGHNNGEELFGDIT